MCVLRVLRVLTAAAACLVLATSVLTGCGGTQGDDPTEQAEAPVGIVIPSTLFTGMPPVGAIPLVDAKSAASVGDRVVFEARIGGRRAPFIENRAMFFVADPSLLSCDQLHGDSCKTPWDYCCETPESLLAHMATVQIVDDGGRPLALSIEGESGLDPSRTIIVVGTVDKADDAGTFVVNAESIHVKEG